MIEKHPICTHRVRIIPTMFSRLDHPLVHERFIERCSHQAPAALYLFLVTVADGLGLSYYSDLSIMKRLSMDETTLARARENLIRIELIAHEKPLYQMLPLDSEPRPVTNKTRTPIDQPISRGQVFKRIAEDLS